LQVRKKQAGDIRTHSSRAMIAYEVAELVENDVFLVQGAGGRLIDDQISGGIIDCDPGSKRAAPNTLHRQNL
jgi:hypothetical protein